MAAPQEVPQPRPKVERQAVAVVTVYLRRQLREANHRAQTCGCPSCKGEPRRLLEWIAEKPEKK